VRTFSANAKFSSPSTAAHLGFMATCIVELFGLDQEVAYAHAFTVRWLHDHLLASVFISNNFGHGHHKHKRSETLEARTVASCAVLNRL
jgi:Noc2p family